MLSTSTNDTAQQLQQVRAETVSIATTAARATDTSCLKGHVSWPHDVFVLFHSISGISNITA